MKTLATITATILTLLLTVTMASAQNSNLTTSEIESMRAERSVAIFNLQNKEDIKKQKEMGETYKLNEEKADLENKRREVQIMDDATYPKYVEMNNQQKAAWDYAQAKKAWVEANPEAYASMLNGASTN